MDMLLAGFDALLKVHGSEWTFGKKSFYAVAQSGAYAAYNFADGNTAVKILRLRADALDALPIKGDVLGTPDGGTCIVQRSRRVDGNFCEIEVDEL